jgi:hypothetical protein
MINYPVILFLFCMVVALGLTLVALFYIHKIEKELHKMQEILKHYIPTH